jgi:DNA-binding transcriptional LysR family regulator
VASSTGLEIRQLRAFVTLVERGGVSAAARALELAQSTVSEALAALERATGAQLAVRRRGSYTGRLTAAGEALLPHARSILSTVDNAHAAVAGVTKHARGAIDIVANESTSTYLLPATLAELRRQWPKIRFSVSIATCAGVRARVAEDGAEVGLLLAWQDELEEGSISLRDVPLVIFARPSHPLVRRASERSIPRSALEQFRIFLPDAEGDFHAAVHRFLTRGGTGTPAVEATGSVEGVKRAMIGDPVSLGLLPAFAVAEEIRMGSMVRLDVRPAVPGMRLVARLARGRSGHPAIDALVAALRSPTDRIRG